MILSECYEFLNEAVNRAWPRIYHGREAWAVWMPEWMYRRHVCKDAINSVLFERFGHTDEYGTRRMINLDLDPYMPWRDELLEYVMKQTDNICTPSSLQLIFFREARFPPNVRSEHV